MWIIVKTELEYHKNSILIFLGIIFFVFIYNTFISPGNAEFMIFLMTFMMINSAVSYRNREKRNLWHFRLPIPIFTFGLIRILVVFVLSILAYVELIVLHLVSLKNVSFPYQRISILIGISILLFLLNFLFHDLFTAFVKKYGGFFVMLIVIVIAVFIILGIFVVTQIESTGSSPTLLITIKNFAKNNNPFAGNFGWIRFLILNLVLSILTLVTFNRCKSYVD